MRKYRIFCGAFCTTANFYPGFLIFLTKRILFLYLKIIAYKKLKAYALSKNQKVSRHVPFCVATKTGNDLTGLNN